MPHFEYVRASSSPFVHVRLENLAVRCWGSVYVPFRTYLGPYAEETWLRVPVRVFTSPILASTPK